jgi:tRNA (adenine22-N1)-methyltransferase
MRSTELPPAPERLSPRLSVIAGLVPECRRLLDVGTDHAWLPIELVRRGRCQQAVAIDLRNGPLAIASRNVTAAGLTAKIAVCQGNGLTDVLLDPDDIVVLAGLGGNEMMHVLGDRPRNCRAIILQPMKSLPELRFWLSEHGYLIDAERLAIEQHRAYAILRCRYVGLKITLSRLEAIVGPNLLQEKPSGFAVYLHQLLTRLKKQSHGDPSLAGPIGEIRALLLGYAAKNP